MYNIVVEFDKDSNAVKPKTVAQKSFSSSDGQLLHDESIGNNVYISSKLSKNSISNASDSSDLRIESMFENYKDNLKPDLILAQGMERFCQDLGLNPDQFEMLALAWKFNADRMCCFTRQSFVNGCQELRAYSMNDLQSKLPAVVEETKHNFKDFYRWTFKFGLDPPQRYLPLDMATALWKLVFHYSNPPPPLLPRWINFLEKQTSVSSIKQDTWDLFLNFVETFKTQELSNYTDAEAWPNLFDEFVEFENDRKNQNLSVEKDSDQHG